MTDVSESAYYSVVSLTPRRPLKSPRCPQRHRRPANLLWPSVPPDYPLRQIFVTFRTKNPRRKKNSSAHWPIPVACLRILNDMATQPIAMAPAGRSTLQAQFSVLNTRGRDFATDPCHFRTSSQPWDTPSGTFSQKVGPSASFGTFYFYLLSY